MLRQIGSAKNKTFDQLYNPVLSIGLTGIFKHVFSIYPYTCMVESDIVPEV